MALEQVFTGPGIKPEAEQAPAPAPNEGGDLTDQEEQDADMATAMIGAVMSTPEMVQSLVQQTANADPIVAVGQYIADAMLNLKEQADANGLPLADKIWVARDGVADRMADQAILNIVAGGGPDLAGSEDAIYQEVINVLKLAQQAGSPGDPRAGGAPAQGGQPPNAAPAGPPAGPPMGPGGMV